jgi:RHS repeat-associated protein
VPSTIRKIKSYALNIANITEIAQTSNQVDFFGTFVPDVLSFNEYYPYGMLLPKRHGAVDSYRYGFNGKEKDDEVKGEGAQYDYGFRIYDARVGKFLSTDPLYKSYPSLTPYQFASNTPIAAVDLDGLEALVAKDYGTLESLKKSINIVYRGEDVEDASVSVTHTYLERSASNTLNNGIGDEELKRAANGDFDLQFETAKKYPMLILYKGSLQKKQSLSYRNKNNSGTALYYVASAMVNNIKGSLKENHQGDRGLVNTFNHLGGQAIITMLYSRYSADFAGDIHERDQPSLRTGKIKKSEVSQAIDNYVDLVNNSWGQKLGSKLAGNFRNNLHNGVWFDRDTSELLNEIQNYYSETFGYEFNEFTKDTPIVKQFTDLLNELKFGAGRAKIIRKNLDKAENENTNNENTNDDNKDN